MASPPVMEPGWHFARPAAARTSGTGETGSAGYGETGGAGRDVRRRIRPSELAAGLSLARTGVDLRHLAGDGRRTVHCGHCVRGQARRTATIEGIPGLRRSIA